MPMNGTCLTVTGLSLDIVGAIFLVRSVFFTGKRKTEYEEFYGRFRWWWPTVKPGQDRDTELPTFEDSIRAHQNALLGLVFLVVGYGLQILAVVL